MRWYHALWIYPIAFTVCTPDFLRQFFADTIHLIRPTHREALVFQARFLREAIASSRESSTQRACAGSTVSAN